LAPKRASLGQGFVEIEMMLRVNKHLFLSTPEAVIKLPNKGWEDFIPNRPRRDDEVDDDEVEEGSSEETIGNEDEVVDDTANEDRSNYMDTMDNLYDDSEKEGGEGVSDVDDDYIEDSQVIQETAPGVIYEDSQSSRNDVVQTEETCDLLTLSPRCRKMTFYLRSK